jgi:hypothetical protein
MCISISVYLHMRKNCNLERRRLELYEIGLMLVDIYLSMLLVSIV